MEENIEELTLLLMYLTSWEEKGFIRDENDYNELYSFIKENMDEFLEQMDSFENGAYYDMFDYINYKVVR